MVNILADVHVRWFDSSPVPPYKGAMMIERYKIAEIGIDGCDSAEEDPTGEWVPFDAHQAELDRVMGLALRFAGYAPKYVSNSFLNSPEVRAWRERQKEGS